MPAPACTYARPSASTIVRMVMHESRLPEKLKYPTAPPYGPRRTVSNRSISSMARICGAPQEHVRRRIDRAQRAIERQRAGGRIFGRPPLREDDLEDLAGDDLFLR